MLIILCNQGPTFTADAVLGRAGALVGAEATYDVLAGAITRYAGAVGYSAADYSVAVSRKLDYPLESRVLEIDFRSAIRNARSTLWATSLPTRPATTTESTGTSIPQI